METEASRDIDMSLDDSPARDSVHGRSGVRRATCGVRSIASINNRRRLLSCGAPHRAASPPHFNCSVPKRTLSLLRSGATRCDLLFFMPKFKCRKPIPFRTGSSVQWRASRTDDGAPLHRSLAWPNLPDLNSISKRHSQTKSFASFRMASSAVAFFFPGPNAHRSSRRM